MEIQMSTIKQISMESRMNIFFILINIHLLFYFRIKKKNFVNILILLVNRNLIIFKSLFITNKQTNKTSTKTSLLKLKFKQKTNSLNITFKMGHEIISMIYSEGTTVSTTRESW